MPILNSLLLDADIVVFSYELELWEALKERHKIAVVGTVVNEAQFFEPSTGGRGGGINLQRQASRGEIEVLEATSEEIVRTFADFSPAFLAQLHDGEKEAIALVHSGRFADFVFCTGDINAIQAMGMLALPRSLSFQEIVESLGTDFHVSRPLRASLTKRTHDIHYEKGKARRISEEYFIRSPLR